MRYLCLLVWIILTSVILCFVRNNDLHVSFRPQGSTFEERHLVFNTSLIHIYSCFNVIQSVCNYSSALEELIAENLFSFLTDLIQTSDYVPLKARVQLKESGTGGC